MALVENRGKSSKKLENLWKIRWTGCENLPVFPHHPPLSGNGCRKFLKDSKGNFFQKVSFGAPSDGDALRQLISSRPDKKTLFPLLCQTPYPLFFAGRRRKEKLTKETPFSKGNFLKKVSSGLFQKLSHNRCREVGGRTPAPASGMCGKRTQSAATAIQPHRRWFSKVFAGVRGRLFQKAPPSRPSLSPARTMSPGAASCGRRV